MRCPICGSSSVEWVTGDAETDRYKCQDCEAPFFKNSGFLMLNDRQRDLIAQLAFANGNYALEQTVSDRVEFTRKTAHEIRNLLAVAIDPHVIGEIPDPGEAKALYDELSAELFEQAPEPA